MEITGNIKQIQELVTGTSKAGKEWSKRTIIVTTTDKYPQDIPVDFLGDSVEQLNDFQEGNPVIVGINLRGSEYNGRHYVSISGWKLSNTIGNVTNAEQNPAREVAADLPF